MNFFVNQDHAVANLRECANREFSSTKLPWFLAGVSRRGNWPLAYLLVLLANQNHVSPGPPFSCVKAPQAKRDKRLRGLCVVSVYSCLPARSSSRRHTFWAHHALHSKNHLVKVPCTLKVSLLPSVIQNCLSRRSGNEQKEERNPSDKRREHKDHNF